MFIAGLVSSSLVQKKRLQARLAREVADKEAVSCHGSYCQNKGK